MNVHYYSYNLISSVLLLTYTTSILHQVCVISFTPNIKINRLYHHNTNVNVLQPMNGMAFTHTITSLQMQSSPFQGENENVNEEGDDNNASSQPQQQHQQHQHQQHQRDSEFNLVEPREMSEKHEKRLQAELSIQNEFVPYGDELWQLRSTLLHLSKQLIQLMAKGHDSSGSESIVSEEEIREMIREVESKDPEFVYASEKEKLERALQEDRLDDARDHREKALLARSVLPQFNLHGLWVGNYGYGGFKMVNITYIGDTLIARKVTGDENVPAGEITFQADLSPPKTTDVTFEENYNRKKLPNIVLSDQASKKWNTKELPRFSGLGQVAEKNYVNSQWMDGQLVFINENYFSFAWLPLNHQILFGRPSIEMMMDQQLIQQQNLEKNTKHSLIDDDFEELNAHVVKCFDATVNLVDECSIQDDSSSCIFYDDDSEHCCFE